MDQHFGEHPAGRPWLLSKAKAFRYVNEYRIRIGTQRLARLLPELDVSRASVLVLCAGEGVEGAVLRQIGFQHIIVCDLSEQACMNTRNIDPLLKPVCCDAEAFPFGDGSFDVVVVQDGLHHLASPVAGFTEALRISRCVTMFLEPHDSWVGRILGRKWEVQGESVNYVFRWTKRLVQDVTCSYLAHDRFANGSFTFWYHQDVFRSLVEFFGGGGFALFILKALLVFSALVPLQRNQMCGLVVQRD